MQVQWGIQKLHPALPLAWNVYLYSIVFVLLLFEFVFVPPLVLYFHFFGICICIYSSTGLKFVFVLFWCFYLYLLLHMKFVFAFVPMICLLYFFLLKHSLLFLVLKRPTYLARTPKVKSPRRGPPTTPNIVREAWIKKAIFYIYSTHWIVSL